MIKDLGELEPLEIYKLISNNIIPRPIAWIVTEHNDIVNIAPFSYFAPISSEPPLVVVSIGYKNDGTPKDTLYNIKKTKKCTICMVNESNLKKMHYTSKPLDKNTSEAEEFNIKTIKRLDNFPPTIQGISTAFFCEFNQEITIKEKGTNPLILEIKYIFKDDKNNQLPISRISKNYAQIGRNLEVPDIP
ncbi:Nitrilotriacetate monooxygenase component B [hydrothermal vent metagenome]|uniref:Nitrilotriacetate monooxygenase component B n=1 Tax=hydrothermal vent metagenome TaxID=652676 RepID=A0A3B1E4L8_9ZZZZ